MRKIQVQAIEEAVYELFLQANYSIEPGIEKAITEAVEQETSDAGRFVLKQLSENYRIARTERMAICQDTGASMVFMDIGQEVYLEGELPETAVNRGVRRAYTEGFLRKSMVKDPLFDRTNTGDNTPAILYTRIVEGDRISLSVAAKGFGCENMSRTKMLVPGDGIDGVKDFILETIRIAGPNTCPPSLVGVGIGGTIDYAAMLSKRALLRPVGDTHPDARYAQLEQELLEKANQLGIGPGGYGGKMTALAVKIESYPTHIASIPVCVTMCCHASRHASRVL